MVALSLAVCFVASLTFAGFVLWLRRQDQGKALAELAGKVAALESRKPDGVVDPEAREKADRALRQLGIIAGFARIDLESMGGGAQK